MIDFSVLIDKVHLFAIWPNNLALAGAGLLLLLLYVRRRSRLQLVAMVDVDASPVEEEYHAAQQDASDDSLSLEMFSVFQVISAIIDHEAVEQKLVEDVFPLLAEKVLVEMQSVGVQGIAISLEANSYEAGECSGDGWRLERVVLSSGDEHGTIQFYGSRRDTESSPRLQKLCLKIADYLAERLSSFLFLKKSTQEVALFRHLIDQASEIVLIIDPFSGKILDVNARACIELGYAHHELAGKRLVVILTAGKDDTFVENESERYGHEMFMETRLIRNDQTTFPVEISLKNIDLADKTYQLGMARDLSARNGMVHQKMEMERQLIQSEKMVSGGQLSAGIAHEINNPISFITSNLGTMGEYVGDLSRLLTEYRNFVRMVDVSDVDLREKHIRLTTLEDKIEGAYLLKDLKDVVSESLEGADRIKQIVLDMKSFAHPGEDKLKSTDINKGLDSTLNIAWNELKYKCEVVKEYGELSHVTCFPQQINQVFMNIIINAGQAIEKDGILTLSTSQMKDIVHISITDNGSGMDKEVVQHIFDPFFTTKEIGKGTGLGLNVAYNIIKKHDGHIEVESHVGKGTTFNITLPVQGPRRQANGVET